MGRHSFVVKGLGGVCVAQAQEGLFLDSWNVHRILLASVVVAAKFLEDRCCSNNYYAKVSCIQMSRETQYSLFPIQRVNSLKGLLPRGKVVHCPSQHSSLFLPLKVIEGVST